MVLFVFVIMLLNAGIEEHTSISKMAGAPGLLLVVALAGFVAATIARSRRAYKPLRNRRNGIDPWNFKHALQRNSSIRSS